MKFNTNSAGTSTVNRAGGKAYKQSPELELVSLLLTSFVSDKFYESGEEQLDRLQHLAKSMKDKEFVGKAAVYARTKFNMRSITHALLAYLSAYAKGTSWLKRAYDKTIIRPDDALETVAFYISKFGRRPIPNSLKKGLSMSLNKFDGYQFAKYRGAKKEVKMVDVINLIHYKPTKEQEKAVKDLINGKLKSTQTWESKLTEAGKSSKTKEEKEEKKKQAWTDLIMEGKIGYFALLRNLRNIHQQSPEVLERALSILTDGRLIKNSRVLPFRFVTAYNEIEKARGTNSILSALDDAADQSLSNVPVFSGKTLIALDKSGSMNGKPWEIGTLFASALAKANKDADLITFSTSSTAKSINPKTPLMDMARSFGSPNGGTNFSAIFEDGRMDVKYDRVIVLSDMQGWMEDTGWYEGHNLRDTMNKYRKKTGATPHIYNFDLNGYGDMKFPENQVYCVAGFSDKVFDVMKLLEKDRNALINEIKAIKL